MTSCRRGDLVLVNFQFSDQLAFKRRPALVLSSETYHRGRQEVIIAAVSSNVRRLLPGDTMAADWRGAGLLAPSVITGIVRTVKNTMVERSLGRLQAEDMRSVEASLRLALSL